MGFGPVWAPPSFLPDAELNIVNGRFMAYTLIEDASHSCADRSQASAPAVFVDAACRADPVRRAAAMRNGRDRGELPVRHAFDDLGYRRVEWKAKLLTPVQPDSCAHWFT